MGNTSAHMSTPHFKTRAQSNTSSMSPRTTSQTTQINHRIGSVVRHLHQAHHGPQRRVPEVFLGGTCGESTWRHKIAIPALTAAGVSYYNPQCGPGEWTPELIPIEAAAKDGASCQLFVITGETRGVASMIEAAELLARGVSIVLCLEPYTANEPDNQDINRGRKYLLEVASRHGCAVHNSVAGATSEVIQRIRALPFALEPLEPTPMVRTESIPRLIEAS